MTSPTDTLREEHRVILRAIALLEVAAGRLTDGRPLPDGWWENLLDWLRHFADRNHHAKEETHLFPALAQAGIPAAGGPVSVMLEEHTEGRALIQAMATVRWIGAWTRPGATFTCSAITSTRRTACCCRWPMRSWTRRVSCSSPGPSKRSRPGRDGGPPSSTRRPTWTGSPRLSGTER